MLETNRKAEEAARHVDRGSEYFTQKHFEDAEKEFRKALRSILLTVQLITIWGFFFLIRDWQKRLFHG